MTGRNGDPHPGSYTVGVDIGGTCTDCVVVDDAGTATVAKAFSTPPDFSAGILNAVGVAAETLGLTLGELLAATDLFLHSTTVAENAIVDGSLARIGLVTTSGFRDTLFATRGGFGRWSGLTDDEKRNPTETEKPVPLVPVGRIAAVKERVDRNGDVVVPLDEEAAERAIRRLLSDGVESIGVCLLWSFRNTKHELAIRRIVERLCPDAFVTLSHEIAPIIGEYERTSTVALNAGLVPVVASYLETLASQLRASGLDAPILVMQAHGGLLPVERASERAVGMIESGPVSGLTGCKRLGEWIGASNIISADLGGTTFKVGIVREGLIEYQRESLALRYHYALPKLDIVSLGLAGGSVIWFDGRKGTPRIGPRSAGSYPGPVVYGHGGTEPTITDVDAILGFMNADYFLGGRAPLAIDAARNAFEQQVAKPLEQAVLEAAAAIYRLANSYIYDLLHRMTIQRGLDPRTFALFSTGGTAGMHLPSIAAELGIPTVVVPYSASVHGAFGLVTSDVVHEELSSLPMHEPLDFKRINGVFAELEEGIRPLLRSEGFDDHAIRFTRSIDMRYRRQVHEVTVPASAHGSLTEDAAAEELIDMFETLYKRRYGPESTYRDAGVELVTFRLRGEGTVRTPEPRKWEQVGASLEDAVVERREVFLPSLCELATVPGYDLERLDVGVQLDGPCLVWSPITTVVVDAGQTARTDAYRNLIVEQRAQ